jgi:DNA-binding helix-hairpin-helix protein with protein kinase domain
MEELVERRRERQRQRFLDQHPIAAARIPGIGPGREVMLASYGVETAADVTDDALGTIAGLGASLKKDLLAWRQQLERGFAYDPRQAIDPGDLSAVEQELAATRTQLGDVLRRGAANLRAIADQTERARRVLRADLDRAVLTLAQADADLSVEG